MAQKTDRQLLYNWEEYRRALVSATHIELDMTIADIVRHREELEANPEEWMKFFFPNYTTADFAPFHKKAIKRLIGNAEWYEVLSWSRELGKDTIVMMTMLYLNLTGKKKFTVFVSSSYDAAVDLLTPYKINLESNLRITTYYGKQQLVGHWEGGDFTTKGGFRYVAIGAGQSPRGKKNEALRPDSIICTDLDTDEDCRNIDIINKRWDWVEKALYMTRSISKPLLFVVLGNIIAKDCCVVRAAERADNHDIVNIRDKHGKSTWPAKNTEEMIDRVLSKLSTKAAQAECYNNPLSEGDTFKEITWGKVPPLSKFRFLVSYGDPAPSNSKNKANSYKANFLVGMLDGNFYVITGYLDHVTNSEYVDWYYYIWDYVGGKSQVYFYTENNKLQDPFYQQVFIPLFINKGKEKGFYLSISPDERAKPDKFSRIEGNLEPLNRQGRLILNADQKDNPHMKRLEEQFKLVNPRLNAPADGPDCIEGGVFIINLKNRSLAAGSISFGKFKPNTKRV